MILWYVRYFGISQYLVFIVYVVYIFYIVYVILILYSLFTFRSLRVNDHLCLYYLTYNWLFNTSYCITKHHCLQTLTIVSHLKIKFYIKIIKERTFAHSTFIVLIFTLKFYSANFYFCLQRKKNRLVAIKLLIYGWVGIRSGTF